MRTLLHGTDSELERALLERGLDLVSDGPADALVTVGPAPALRPLAEIPAEDWLGRFEAWVEGPFWAFQAWLRDVLERRSQGRWVAITSALAAQPFPGGGADGTAAVALQTLVRIAAVEYGAQGIRANAIAAGWSERSLPAELDRELALADTPTGRLATSSDVAAAVAWLLSEDAGQVTGQVLRVDGGYTITQGSRPDPRKG
jgi:NAD(P)-dependent dehydrogenase (short-subunit alcohol dehydrogenase family)